MADMENRNDQYYLDKEESEFLFERVIRQDLEVMAKRDKLFAEIDEINISYKEDGSMEVDMPKRTPIKDSYVDLYYGWEDSTHGIYHAFLATDLGDRPDPEDMRDELAEMLELKPDDEDFGWNFMQIKLPESLILRIQKKAVEDYLLGRLEV